ncbi:MAG: exodeoxyribonuclease V subunit gamma, partial [Pseudomonadota bacterium]
MLNNYSLTATSTMPGFHLYTSNRLEKLSEHLAGILRASPLEPLQTEIIVVQSRGMEHWLNLEIARRNSLSANIAFPFPKAFVYKVFKDVLDQPDESFFSPDIMSWRIMKLLPGLIDKPGFESLKQYVAGENSPLKLYQLSEKIAAAFDQYLVYRPDIITEWDQGKNRIASGFKHAAWQAELWQHMAGPDGNAQALHPAGLKNLFREKIQKGALFPTLPPRISIFGISTLPPFYLEVISGLARTLDIHFYYLNPCREYWEYAYSEKEIARLQKGLTGEDQYYEKGNSLLASMGVSGREFFSLILSALGDTGEALFEEPGQDTMLQRIQSDILHLTDSLGETKGALPLQDDDRSIRIHSCYSAMREVEVLYDNLLYLFDTTPGLLPKDIVVMTPDIATYAPLIQAVFDTPEEEHLKIPYSLADTSIRMESSLAAVFLSILTLDRQRFRAPAVLDILEAKAVRKKFGLTEKDMETITSWVSETEICWGIDGRYRTELDLPGFHENTWAFGLERMLLGYALPERDVPELFSGILPYGEIEGGSALALGSFTRFMEALFACRQLLLQEHTLARWSDELCRLLATFFIVDDETEHDLKKIRDALTEEGLAGFAVQSGFDEKVPLDIIRAYLDRHLEAQTGRHGFISRGVTFCTMLPMRSIPFKVVYLLGMNDSDYPRSFARPGFDLMEHCRRLCDRSKRHEDRFIFLESILSARENLIISYVGRSIKDTT